MCKLSVNIYLVTLHMSGSSLLSITCQARGNELGLVPTNMLLRKYHDDLNALTCRYCTNPLRLGLVCSADVIEDDELPEKRVTELDQLPANCWVRIDDPKYQESNLIDTANEQVNKGTNKRTDGGNEPDQ